MSVLSKLPGIRKGLSQIYLPHVIKAFFRYRKLWWFTVSLLISMLVGALLFRHSMLRQEAIFMSAIFVVAALLWITEALPLFVTSILIIALEIIFLANPGNWSGLGFDNGASPPFEAFLAPLSNPVIVLFFGGFILAHAAVKEGVDKIMAGMILRLFGGKPRKVLLGMMLVTALFSMWMSNTATTAMMIALLSPMLAQLKKQDPFRKALLLSVPFAANIGGMGTPIASPPNAVAVSYLQQAGFEKDFLSWMLIALPLMLGLLLMTWLLLMLSYRPQYPHIVLKPVAQKTDTKGWYVIAVLALTVLLWLTDWLHGLSSAVVALFPVLAFTATGILTYADINRLEWHILILIMGGIALGEGMQLTGLDQTVISMLPAESGTFPVIVVATTLLLSTFISNTAAANLLLPIGISFALQQMAATGVIQVGVSIALMASLAMAMPISTPPNTIAYSKGELATTDFIKTGAFVGLIAMLLIAFLAEPIIGFWINLLD